MCAFNDVPRRRGSLTGGGRNNNHNNNNNNNENKNVMRAAARRQRPPLGRATGHSPSVVVGGVCRRPRRAGRRRGPVARPRQTFERSVYVSPVSVVRQFSSPVVVLASGVSGLLCGYFFFFIFILSYILDRRLCSFRSPSILFFRR